MLRIRSIIGFAQGPTFLALSGERRRAYIRQWKIGAALLAVFALAATVIAVTSVGSTELAKRDNILFVFIVIALSLQLFYALFKQETLWQLRLRELRARKESSKQNEQDIHNFMAEMKNKNDDQGAPRI